MWGRQSSSFGEEGKSKESHNNNNQCNCIADYEQSVWINSSDIVYDSLSDVGEIRVYQRADFQSGSRVLKKVF